LTLFDPNPASGEEEPAFDEGGSGTEDDGGMAATTRLIISPQALRRGLLVLIATAVLSSAAAHAQNLDQGKPAAKLFADSCTACHHSARGLAKGRFSLTLFLFLQKHYATNSSSAWALTSYLESVDTPRRRSSRAATAKPQAAAHSTSGAASRPAQAMPVR
jgi:mono/diheme cytochrome c family protein